MPQQKLSCRGTHTRGDGSWWLRDARGIEIARVCQVCEPEVKADYRPEIFTNPQYWTDEPVEEQ